MRKLSIAMLFIIAVLAMLAVVAFFGWRQSNRPLQARFSRPWLTNEANGAPAVAMFLTNASGCNVRRWGHFGTENRQSTWSQNPQRSIGPDAILRPGQVEVLMMSAPTNPGPWKAVAFLSRENWRTKVTNLPWWGNAIRRRFGGIPTEIFPTDWIENQPPSDPP